MNKRLKILNLAVWLLIMPVFNQPAQSTSGSSKAARLKVKKLTEEEFENLENDSKNREFTEAFKSQDFNSIKRLAHLDLQDQYGNTALMLAVSNNPLFAQALIEAGADPNLQNNNGYTALMSAVIWNKPLLVKAFIKAKADLNLQNIFGETVLMLAVISNKPLIIQELIEAGANLNLKNNNGKTALTIAVENDLTNIIQVIVSTIKTVLDESVV